MSSEGMITIAESENSTTIATPRSTQFMGFVGWRRGMLTSVSDQVREGWNTRAQIDVVFQSSTGFFSWNGQRLWKIVTWRSKAGAIWAADPNLATRARLQAISDLFSLTLGILLPSK